MLVSLVLPFQLMRLLQYEQAEARSEALSMMQQKYDAKTLKYIAIPKDELEGRGSRFVRIHATEFVWDGIMYDIVGSFPEAHQTWFLVYPDYKETKVLKQKIALAKAFHSESGLTTTSSKQSISFHWFAGRAATIDFGICLEHKTAYQYFVDQYSFQPIQHIEHPPQMNWL
jgi:hypothetical protein